MLKEKLYADMKEALKAGNTKRLSAIRYILGEMGRLPSKEATDEQIISIVKKTVSAEEEVLSIKGEKTSYFLEVLKEYLPEQISSEEIEKWVRENIDISQYKNKMQAMKPIMDHFGQSADGKTVSEILKKM